MWTSIKIKDVTKNNENHIKAVQTKRLNSQIKIMYYLRISNKYGSATNCLTIMTQPNNYVLEGGAPNQVNVSLVSVTLSDTFHKEFVPS
jgi:hypothetical protein